jgi:dTDP-4-amino-4,6-dideoxygalactose transaminase
MLVPLLDLKRQYASLQPEIEARVSEVIASQQFILGPVVATFEEAVRAFCGAGCAVGMSSGTDAQLATLMALEIGPGDAVLTTPYTFFATAGCIARVGARPVFADIEAGTFNLSVDAVAHYLTNEARRDAHGVLRTPTGECLRAIIPVHLFGLCCAMDEILALGREFGLPVLEDASQALGAEYFSAAAGKTFRAGAMGELNWFSFFPSKNLGAFGDGGMTTGRDVSHLAKLRALRMHGMEEQYIHRFIGGNFRLDALQAAVLQTKLPHLDAWSTARRAHAAWYRTAFAQAGLQTRVMCPAEPQAETGTEQHHIYHQFVVRVAAADRDPLRTHLTAAGIGNAVYYPLALHEQECFRDLGYGPGDFPMAEAAARESLALPIFPELSLGELEAVVSAIADFYS